MGASGVGEIEQLSTICNPTSGLITNISSVHIKGFKNIEGVVRGKSELFDFLIKTEGDAFVHLAVNPVVVLRGLKPLYFFLEKIQY